MYEHIDTAAIHDWVNRRIGYEMTAREVQIRRELVARMRHAIQNINDTRRDDIPTMMAEAALDAFLEYYQQARGNGQ